MDAGNTAFVLLCAALVMLMTPGLAFFYGGMVRVKSVLNMLMMSFICLAVVTVLWVLFGFSMAFSTDAFGGLVGNLDWYGMRDIGLNQLWDGYTIPISAFALFQMMFAVITPALISGAIADRTKFTAWTVFVALWVTIVYFPIAHWVWAADGWLFKKGVIDFAGGTAVHINAGVAALALTFVLGKRVGFKRDPMRPHSLPLVLLGAGLLWFGWFGFNAGSWLGADGVTGRAAINTQIAAAAAILGWMALEKFRDGHFTLLGGASGAIAGLVAITPACGSISPLGSIALGIVTGVVCAWAVGLKYKLGYDDSLDVVGVHLVGGVIGSIAPGLLATGKIQSDAQGLFYGGGFDQLGKQLIGVGAVLAYSFIATFIIGFAIQKTMGFRVTEEVETSGIDQAEHAETAYDYAGIGGTRSSGTTTAASKSAPVEEKVEA
jgi:Amt family ammonium transporter